MARVTKEELIRLQQQFKTDSAIGSFLKISRQAVHQLRMKYGILSLSRKNSTRNAEIQQQYRKGIPGTDLAKKYNLSVSQTYRIINDHKDRAPISVDGVIPAQNPEMVKVSGEIPMAHEKVHRENRKEFASST